MEQARPANARKQHDHRKIADQRVRGKLDRGAPSLAVFREAPGRADAPLGVPPAQFAAQAGRGGQRRQGDQDAESGEGQGQVTPVRK